MHKDEVVNLASDVPVMPERRRFLTLLGAGTALSVLPPNLSGIERYSGKTNPVTGPEWVFEEPPVVLDQDPSRVLLDQNENPIAPSAVERRAIEKAIELANRYPDAEGALKSDLATLHGVDTDCILMGCGSTEMLKVCADAFLGPGKELLQTSPTYPTIERYGRVRGADIISIPVDSNGFSDIQAMQSSLGSRTAVVYLCNPNNPTGTIMPDSRVRRFLESVPDEAVIVCDEAYIHYVNDPAYRSLIDLAVERTNVVVLYTFSKVYGLAGLRIGYAVAHPELIERMAPHKLAINLNNPGLHAAIAALTDENFVNESVRINALSRNAIIREMPRFGGRPLPSQAGFVWVDFGRQTRPIRNALAEEHVYVRTYGHSPEHLRISTGRSQDMDRLFEAMEKVTAV